VAEELVLERVTRDFADRRALDDVSFSVRAGRMTGFVGANGAGKTTAMRIVMGVLAASGGTVTLDGRPLDRQARRLFGYMPEERGLYPRMKVLDQLVYLGRVHGMSRARAKARAMELLERFDLADRAQDLLQALSLGNQQRVQVAAAVLHDPVLLILDEPFSGLDPIAIDAMGVLVRERAEAGVPVLFSSHQLELVETLCDDVVIIKDGRVVAAGSADEVRRGHGERRLRVQVDPEPSDAPRTDFWSAMPGVELSSREETAVVLSLAPDVNEQTVLAAAQQTGLLREFAPVRPSLAEIFREVGQ
jgi:ABC-2 type transport system ATP-binding protein